MPADMTPVVPVESASIPDPNPSPAVVPGASVDPAQDKPAPVMSEPADESLAHQPEETPDEPKRTDANE